MFEKEHKYLNYNEMMVHIESRKIWIYRENLMSAASLDNQTYANARQNNSHLSINTSRLKPFIF